MKFTFRTLTTTSLALLSLSTLVACGAIGSAEPPKPLATSEASSSASASASASASPSASASASASASKSASASRSAAASPSASRSAAASPSAQAKKDPVIPEGYQVAEAKNAKITFALPGNWRPLDSETYASSDEFRERMQNSSDGANMTLEQAQKQIRSLDMLAMSDTAGVTGYTNNMAVLKHIIFSTSTPPHSQLVGILVQTGNTELDSSGTEVTPLGEAIWQSYTGVLGGGQIVYGRMLAVPTGEEYMYSLITVTTDNPEETARIAEGILGSLQPL